VVRGRDGARLRVIDFGGEGRPVLFVHGLAGHGSEWSRVAQLLPRELRPLAFDLRGHGGSERRPGDASLAAHADDVARVAGQMAPGEPLFLVGQSVGGIVAFVAASRRPEIVRALVVVEAAPTGPHPEAPARISGWLDSWPSPFPGRGRAMAFFGGPPHADGWDPLLLRDHPPLDDQQGEHLAAAARNALHNPGGAPGQRARSGWERLTLRRRGPPCRARGRTTREPRGET
jgi:pimeloyl-ACP methyl ester carboxylesterase